MNIDKDIQNTKIPSVSFLFAFHYKPLSPPHLRRRFAEVTSRPRLTRGGGGLSCRSLRGRGESGKVGSGELFFCFASMVLFCGNCSLIVLFIFDLVWIVVSMLYFV